MHHQVHSLIGHEAESVAFLHCAADLGSLDEALAAIRDALQEVRTRLPPDSGGYAQNAHCSLEKSGYM